MILEWTDQLSIGNAIIDSDHKGLIIMVNGAKYIIKKSDSFAISKALDQIERHLRFHFVNEEMIAQSVKFSFAHNSMDHLIMLKTLHYLRKVIVENRLENEEVAAENYCELLDDWLTNHILGEDMRMKPLLQTYPYDFNPTGFYPELVLNSNVSTRLGVE